MCSSPKPRTKSKGKKSGGGSILANISPESRRRFSERANAAQDRRDEIRLVQKQKVLQQQVASKRHVNIQTNKTKTQDKSFSYWLINANLKEIFVLLFLGKSKVV
ncbi:hypothetical protein ACPUVO_15830 [Pseudocolwellia sp. HL-MZ19]|uniref:hypothetical protein n=1 Tax=unclassified Pseudocolwellia TaxID=2848178 RepID=UPI003CF39484